MVIKWKGAATQTDFLMVQASVITIILVKSWFQILVNSLAIPNYDVNVYVCFLPNPFMDSIPNNAALNRYLAD